MLDSDDIENALLIHGPTGTGKTTNCQKICKSPLKQKPTTTKTWYRRRFILQHSILLRKY
jgi:adenylate kinase family enzyme